MLWKRLLSALFAGVLLFGTVACEAEGGEGEVLEEGAEVEEE